MPELAFAIPGDLNAPTGGYAYARHLMRELPGAGWNVRHLQLPGNFPDPSGASLQAVADSLATVPGDTPVLIDGLAYGALPSGLIEALARRFVALVHHPLGLETGLSPERARALIACERAALAKAEAVIVTSPETGRTLERDFGVPRAAISVAPPGVEPAPRSPAAGDPARLLAVGSLVPRKGYDVLVTALAMIADLPWSCRIVGAEDRGGDTAAAVRALVAQAGLEDRISLLGAMSDESLAHEYAGADVFVLASHYEGYGMVFTEALSRGLPIVACAGGATAETVPADAGLLVAPGDAEGFAAALRRLLTADGERRRRADAAWAHATRLPVWADTARAVAGALERLP